MVEQSLAATVFAQMLAKAGLKKHGLLEEQVSVKDFFQLNDIDIMELLDPASLTPEQKCQALGIVKLIKEQRDINADDLYLKGYCCVNDKPQ